MTTTEIKTIKIDADEGKVLTDGQTYGVTIFLPANKKPEDFYEITREEYEKTLEALNETEEQIDEDVIVEDTEPEVINNEQ